MIDSSVAVAAFVESHSGHAPALRCLDRIRKREDAGLIAAHGLAETFAVLSSSPIRPRITPEGAALTIRKNLLPILRIVALSGRDYSQVIQRLADAAISGGAIYDALAARAAERE